MFHLQSQWSPETRLLPVRSAWETSARNPSVSSVNILGTQRAHSFLYPNFSVTASWIVVLDTSGMMWCNSHAPRIWRDFGSALPFQTRLTQTKPVVPLSNEHGSQVKDEGRRQCCHNKHKKFPYRPTRDVSLLSRQAS
jgi:hypothetical protein